MQPNRSAGPAQPAAPIVAPETHTVEVLRLAPLYRVLIHNDAVTPMAFVVFMLRDVFRKPAQDAASIMLEAHETGVALVTVMSLEEAEFRVEKAHAFARSFKFPLTFSYEPEER